MLCGCPHGSRRSPGSSFVGFVVCGTRGTSWGLCNRAHVPHCLPGGVISESERLSYVCSVFSRKLRSRSSRGHSAAARSSHRSSIGIPGSARMIRRTALALIINASRSRPLRSTGSAFAGLPTSGGSPRVSVEGWVGSAAWVKYAKPHVAWRPRGCRLRRPLAASPLDCPSLHKCPGSRRDARSPSAARGTPAGG